MCVKRNEDSLVRSKLVSHSDNVHVVLWGMRRKVVFAIGTFKTKKGKRWPVIRTIHRHVTNGRSRFANFSGACFKELLELLDKHPE